MIIDLITDETLACAEWRNIKKFDIECSQIFKDAIDTYFRNYAKENHIPYSGALDLKDAKFNKYVSPHGIEFEFIITQKTGYKITPKPTDE